MDSQINWRLVAYAVGGCWLIFVLLYLLGVAFRLPLNPFPIVVKAIYGGLVYGYVGSTSGHNTEATFVYWTLVGLWLSWWLHKSNWKPALVIGLTALFHIVLSALAFFPLMLIGGR